MIKTQFLLPHLALCALIIAVATGCSGTKQELQTSHSVPAAAGEVSVKEGKNGNTDIDVKVKHLAEPGAVESQSTTYVVWAKDSSSGAVSNLGALKVDKDLSGRLITVTPLKNFDLFITPESQIATTTPSGEHLLWTHFVVE